MDRDRMEEENFTLKQQIEEQFAEIQKLKQQVVKLKPTDDDDDDDETSSPPPPPPPPRRKKGQIL